MAKLKSPTSLASTQREELLRQGLRMAQEDADKELIYVSNRDRISIKDKYFSLDSYFYKPTLDVIMLARAVERAFYDPEDSYSKPPVCYALSVGNGLGMTPDERSAQPQAAACDGCTWNRFGTSQTGNGKRCREYRRVAVIADGAADRVTMLRVPPTSIRPFRNYLNRVLAKRRLRIHQVITHLEFRQKASFPLLVFKFKKEIREVDLERVNQYSGSSVEMVMAPYAE